jgi:transcriptional regulator with XRE-family HTH domain
MTVSAVVLRDVIGSELRRHRKEQGRTLREVAGAARVSLGYLSEVERGQKEASSELLAAICTALDTPLSSLLHSVSLTVAAFERGATAVSVLPARGPVRGLRAETDSGSATDVVSAA